MQPHPIPVESPEAARCGHVPGRDRTGDGEVERRVRVIEKRGPVFKKHSGLSLFTADFTVIDWFRAPASCLSDRKSVV